MTTEAGLAGPAAGTINAETAETLGRKLDAIFLPLAALIVGMLIFSIFLSF
jgi:hypothetical protein